jgi:hypothetical protein
LVVTVTASADVGDDGLRPTAEMAGAAWAGAWAMAIKAAAKIEARLANRMGR